jgi:hypothetical protein
MLQVETLLGSAEIPLTQIMYFHLKMGMLFDSVYNTGIMLETHEQVQPE